MLRVFDCIAFQHNPRLELLAALIALFGSYITIRLILHVARQPQAARRPWLAAAAVAAGCVIWATHSSPCWLFRPVFR